MKKVSASLDVHVSGHFYFDLYKENAGFGFLIPNENESQFR